MDTTIGASQTSLANSSTSSTSAVDYYIGRWVSPLVDQTSISANTWNYKFAAQESNANANFPRNGAGVLYVNCYVWKPSNGTKYGTILDGNTAADFEEAGTSETAIEGTFSGAAVSSLTAGDAVIVFEAWARVTQGHASSYTQTYYFDGTTESSTSSNAAHIETPETIAFDTGLDRVDKTLTLKWNILQKVPSSSLLLDGVNDYCDCTDDATLWSQGLTKFSFTCWIYPTLINDGTSRYVVNHGDGNAHGFTCVIDDATAGEIKFQIRNSVNSILIAASTALVLNRWNHISCVYDNSLGSQNIKVYVDKVVGATTATLTETINQSATLRLGGGSTDLKGNIKDFRWFTTKALTQTEIDNIYSNSPSAPPADYWLLMNEGTGNTVDMISHTKTGTLSGTVWEDRSPLVWSGKHLTLRWNTIGRISKALILKWNIIGRISKALTLKWDIEAALERIDKLLTLKWNTIGRVSKNLTLKWNIIQFVTKALTVKWNIIGRVSKALTLKWNIIGRISKALTLKWDIIGRISKALTLKWNIIGRISKALTLKWNIIERVSKALILKWNIIGRISKTLTLKWNIEGLERVLKDLILKWNIQERISKNLTLKWDIVGRISKALTLKWNIIGRISKALILKWNIEQRVLKDLVLKWHIQNFITKTLTLKWNIQNFITKPLTLKWNIEQRIVKDLILKWNILEADLERVTKNLILKWNIVGRITKELTLRWHIIGRITKTLTLRWTIINRITKDLILKWNIVTRVTKTLTLRWAILGRITKDIILIWQILSATRTIEFPGKDTPISVTDTEGTIEKRKSPGFWRNSFYTRVRTRRKGTSKLNSG